MRTPKTTPEYWRVEQRLFRSFGYDPYNSLMAFYVWQLFQPRPD